MSQPDVGSITKHDSDILDFIFNPVGLPQFMAQPNTNANNVKEETWQDPLLNEFSKETVDQAKKLEVEAIRLAEERKFDESLEIFSKALELTPGNPSVLNNRAQTLRLKGDVEAALQDLNLSISKCEQNLSGFKKIASQAYTQRGVIKEFKEDEEGARSDFEKGAKLGNQLAAQECVKLNPYAKLCNSMLAEAMKHLGSE